MRILDIFEELNKAKTEIVQYVQKAVDLIEGLNSNDTSGANDTLIREAGENILKVFSVSNRYQIPLPEKFIAILIKTSNNLIVCSCSRDESAQAAQARNAIEPIKEILKNS